MIDSIRLINFQSHKDTTIDFALGVNVIVGSSDSGKSSIIRALRYVAQGRPTGDSMVHHGEKNCSVTIATKEGIVSKLRKGAVPSYEIGEGLNKEILKASGQEVPQEVSDVLCLLPVNLQAQHDAPFLLSASSGEVARAFNDAVDLSEIDTALSNSDQALRRCRDSIKGLNADIEEQGKKAEEFAGLDDIDRVLSGAEILDEKINKLLSDKDSIERFISKLRRVENKIEELGGIGKAKALMTEAEKLTKKIDVVEAKKNSIARMVRQMEAIEIQELEADLAKRRKRFAREMPDICPLCGKN